MPKATLLAWIVAVSVALARLVMVTEPPRSPARLITKSSASKFSFPLVSS